jgi:hypothetical protein
MCRLTRVETSSAKRARALHRSPCDKRLAREQAAALVDADLAEPLAALDRERRSGLSDDALHDRLVDPDRADEALRRHEPQR